MNSTAFCNKVLGAWLGYDTIDPKWKVDLELRGFLLGMADDLALPEKTLDWQKNIGIQRKANTFHG